MRNSIKHALIIAVAALMVMAFAGCQVEDFFGDGDQTVIKITGMSEHNTKFASGGVVDPSQTNKKDTTKGMAVAYPTKIENGEVTLYMMLSSGKAASVDNKPAFVVLFINNNNSSTNNEKEMFINPTKPITPGLNTFAFSAFAAFE